MHFAQLNIGRFKGTLIDPWMKDFFVNVDRINAIAERMPGFIARITESSPWDNDPYMAVNMSVWKSPEALKKFVWETAHVQIYSRKAEFFEIIEGPSLVMWWVNEGELPTLIEGKERLEHLRTFGPDEYAFGWTYLGT